MIFQKLAKLASRKTGSLTSSPGALEPETTRFKWMEMVISNHISCKDLVHHPIEKTLYTWMAIRFQVPENPTMKLKIGRRSVLRERPKVLPNKPTPNFYKLF